MSKSSNDITLRLEQAFSTTASSLKQGAESDAELLELISACQEFERIYQEWLTYQNPFRCLDDLQLLKARLSK